METVMTRFAKVFEVAEGLGTVLIYWEEDEEIGCFFTVIMTEIEGERYVSQMSYRTREEAATEVSRFMQSQAEFYFNNTRHFKEAPPGMSIEFLLEKTYDEYVDWIEDQDPHNLNIMLKVMNKNPIFKEQAKVLEIFIKNNVKKND